MDFWVLAYPFLKTQFLTYHIVALNLKCDHGLFHGRRLFLFFIPRPLGPNATPGVTFLALMRINTHQGHRFSLRQAILGLVNGLSFSFQKHKRLKVFPGPQYKPPTTSPLQVPSSAMFDNWFLFYLGFGLDCLDFSL